VFRRRLAARDTFFIEDEFSKCVRRPSVPTQIGDVIEANGGNRAFSDIRTSPTPGAGKKLSSYAKI
jgi:hypothetical protein